MGQVVGNGERATDAAQPLMTHAGHLVSARSGRYERAAGLSRRREPRRPRRGHWTGFSRLRPALPVTPISAVRAGLRGRANWSLPERPMSCPIRSGRITSPSCASIMARDVGRIACSGDARRADAHPLSVPARLPALRRHCEAGEVEGRGDGAAGEGPGPSGRADCQASFGTTTCGRWPAAGSRPRRCVSTRSPSGEIRSSSGPPAWKCQISTASTRCQRETSPARSR